jgi:hypothetical protein
MNGSKNTQLNNGHSIHGRTLLIVIDLLFTQQHCGDDHADSSYQKGSIISKGEFVGLLFCMNSYLDPYSHPQKNSGNDLAMSVSSLWNSKKSSPLLWFYSDFISTIIWYHISSLSPETRYVTYHTIFSCFPPEMRYVTYRMIFSVFFRDEVCNVP